MKANFEQSANSSTTRLHERLYGTGSLSERKNYGLLKMKAQKRHKSIKRKHCGDGGSFTLACSTTYKVIEELLSIPISKLRLTPAKNGFCNEVFEVECEDCTRAIVKVYSNASKIRMEPDERGKFDVLLSNIGISPNVIAISESGIAHEFIIGNSMAEIDIHFDDKFPKKLAQIVSKLHRENGINYEGIFRYKYATLGSYLYQDRRDAWSGNG
jgi:hypothetical protein